MQPTLPELMWRSWRPLPGSHTSPTGSVTQVHARTVRRWVPTKPNQGQRQRVHAVHQAPHPLSHAAGMGKYHYACVKTLFYAEFDMSLRPLGKCPNVLCIAARNAASMGNLQALAFLVRRVGVELICATCDEVWLPTCVVWEGGGGGSQVVVYYRNHTVLGKPPNTGMSRV